MRRRRSTSVWTARSSCSKISRNTWEGRGEGEDRRGGGN